MEWAERFRPANHRFMREITLQEVLAARDARAASQRRLLEAYGKPLLSVTMNIAGPVKRSGLIDFAFRDVLHRLRDVLGAALLRQELTDAPAGLEAILVCAIPAKELKRLALVQETCHPAARLYDLDVIDSDGQKLSRPQPRICLVCGGPVGPCSRSRAHGLPAVQDATQKLLRTLAADRLSEYAVEALLKEVELTPKPGLVDRRNSGAHTDMDLPLFHRSARVLQPYFRRAAELGLEGADCMPALQRAGREAETAMFTATGGVNTHKGAIYALGLVLAAQASALVRGGDAFKTASALAAAGIPPEASSHGQRSCTRYGVSGARGEALAGFPHARKAAKILAEQGPLAALLTLLAEVGDTNLLHRGGCEGLRFVQESAADILAGPAEAYASRLEALDDACIQRDLSPGGSADLLALALLLDRIGAES